MDERAREIEYKGIKIWYSDYSNLRGEEFVNYVHSNIDKFMNRPPEEYSNSLIFLDITNASFSREVLAAFERSGKIIKPHQKALAVIGVAGMKKFFVDFLRRMTLVNARIFDSAQEALDWLVAHAEEK